MWLMTRHGFVSIVEKPEDHDQGTLTVRARNATALNRFVARAGREGYRAKIHIETDYPYREVLTRSEVETAVRWMLDDITYTNFKNAAKAELGAVYASFLARVWTSGLSLTPSSVQAQVNRKWRLLDAAAGRRKGTGKKGKKQKSAPDDGWLEFDQWLNRRARETDDMGERPKSVHDMTDAEWDAFMQETGGI